MNLLSTLDSLLASNPIEEKPAVRGKYASDLMVLVERSVGVSTMIDWLNASGCSMVTEQCDDSILAVWDEDEHTMAKAIMQVPAEVMVVSNKQPPSRLLTLASCRAAVIERLMVMVNYSTSHTLGPKLTLGSQLGFPPAIPIPNAPRHTIRWPLNCGGEDYSVECVSRHSSNQRVMLGYVRRISGLQDAYVEVDCALSPVAGCAVDTVLESEVAYVELWREVGEAFGQMSSERRLVTKHTFATSPKTLLRNALREWPAQASLLRSITTLQGAAAL